MARSSNLAEQALRHAKIHLKISGCFRSLETTRAYCRIHSYLITIRLNAVPPMKAIRDALAGHPCERSRQTQPRSWLQRRAERLESAARRAHAVLRAAPLICHGYSALSQASTQPSSRARLPSSRLPSCGTDSGEQATRKHGPWTIT